MARVDERRAFVLSVAAAAWMPGAWARGQATGSDAEGGSALRPWLEFYSGVASRHDFRVGDRPGEPLDLDAKPVLVYSHPSGLKGTHGAFYVWTHARRPEVVGSIWSYEAPGKRRTIVHEFDSLATSPLAEIRIAKGVWSQRRVIQPQPVPDAPTPGDSARVRATQIKQIAGRFEGYSTTNDVEVKLRMLPRPLYQSQSRDGAAHDYALFGFFADWDPEIVLLIETRETPDGPRWHYSPARFNVCPMWLDYAKARVWKVEKEPNTAITFGDPSGPFFAVHEVAAQPSTPETPAAKP